MMTAIETYQAGTLGFDELVGELHGAIEAGDFRDADLVHDLYERWGPLEEWRATPEERRVAERIDSHVKAMQAFLVEAERKLTTKA